MWLFTPFGFYSVVFNRDCSPGMLCVRARYKEDLDRLREKFLPELGPTEKKDLRDYKFRAYAPQHAVADAMKRFVESIDYHNFKDEVMKTIGLPRELQCSRVWGVMATPASEYEWQAKKYRQKVEYGGYQTGFSFSSPPKVTRPRAKPVESLFDPRPGDTGFEEGETFVDIEDDPTIGDLPGEGLLASGTPAPVRALPGDDFDMLLRRNGFSGELPGVASTQPPFHGKNKRRGRKNRRHRNRHRH